MIQVFDFIKISANITKTNIVTAIMIISNRNIKNNSSHQGLHTVQTKSSPPNIKKGKIFITWKWNTIIKKIYIDQSNNFDPKQNQKNSPSKNKISFFANIMIDYFYLIKIYWNVSQRRISNSYVERENYAKNYNGSTIRSFKLLWFHCPTMW